MNKAFIYIFEFVELNEHQNINGDEQLVANVVADKLNENIFDQDMDQNGSLIEFGTYF